MKHKFLIVLLAIAAVLGMAFGLAGCGDKELDDTGKNPPITDPSGGEQDGQGDRSEEGSEGLQYQTRKDEAGNEYATVVGLGTARETDIVIPAVYRGLPVKEIDQSAFAVSEDERNATLTSVFIPDGVTRIGDQAFDGCIGLTKITIPDSLTEIGSYAFSCCIGLMEITIPDGVTEIGYGAFDGCGGLERFIVEADNTVYNSQDGILYNKAQTQMILVPHAIKGAVTIPDGVTKIGDRAFYSCEGLTSVIIGSGVSSIEESAFWNCSGLTEITIPDNVTAIGRWAFSGSGLTEVKLGSGVTSIENGAFYNCGELKKVYFKNPNGWKGSSDLWGDLNITGLEDPARAASYLTDTYREYDWKREG